MTQAQRQERHGVRLSAQLLPQPKIDIYSDEMPESSDIRRLRVEEHLWKAYKEIVGDGGRSADLKAYIEWRIRNPTTPLPGERFGPIKRERQRRTPTTVVEPDGA